MNQMIEFSLYLLLSCRLTIGMIFTISSISKLLFIKDFESTISKFNIIPSKFSRLSSILIMVSEFLVVLFMVLHEALLTIGFLFSIAILLLFTLALAIVIMRRMKIKCNCFGSGNDNISYFDLMRNIGLIIVCFIGLIASQAVLGLSESPPLINSILIVMWSISFTILWINLSNIGWLTVLFRNINQ
jgi:hypothetical protein